MRLLLAGAGATTLSSAAFVRLSAEHDDGKTGEEQMLAASRAELQELAVPARLQRSNGVRRRVYLFLEAWLVEPLLTAARFLHLVVIFVPVIVAVPAVWLGARDKARDNERAGTLWWYGFLVRSMERAGAAFIKVRAGVDDWA